MIKLIAYHNDPNIKEDILNQLQFHYDADEIVKGVYWQNGKGCAVGCTIYSGRHSEYENRFGIPIVLARLEDRIFEGLPNNLSKEWPLKFMKAINIGSDLSDVWKKFVVWLLSDSEYGVIQYAITVESKNAIKLVCDLYEEWILKEIDPIRFKQARKIAASAASAFAASAAFAAAATAVDAADAAAYAAISAADAAVNADAAISAADAVSYAAISADASSKNHYVAQSEKLLQLLSEELPIT